MKNLAHKISSLPPQLESLVVPAGGRIGTESIQGPATTGARALVDILVKIGVTHAFGLVGGAVVPLVAAVAESPIRFMHFRHESGAAFAALEASLASGKPVVVLTTTGPGITNAITGMVAARWEGAKVILVSASTPAPKRGRFAFQDTSDATFSSSGVLSSGPFFHYATTIESAEELEVVASRLAVGARRRGGFVAHLSMPLGMQGAACRIAPQGDTESIRPAVVDAQAVADCAELLGSAPFVVWAGFGSRGAAPAIRSLAERTGAMVMCSPRGKGSFPEDHPQYLGVTGLGGHQSVESFFVQQRPRWVLVLGTRLGEFTSFWSRELTPAEGFIHVDIDPEAFGAAYPAIRTIGVQADVGDFVRGLLGHLPDQVGQRRAQAQTIPKRYERPIERRTRAVRPSVLMEAVQRFIVDATGGVVMSEAGNSFVICSHYLRFQSPERYRVSTGFGSMGHATAGVIGAAIATGQQAFAVVGDGSMLMQNEISTAVQYGIDAVWIVLNDSKYNMIDQGMSYWGYAPVETSMPRTDFVAVARGMGAEAVRVETERDLEGAIAIAKRARGPFVIDVDIDPTEPSPFVERVKSLAEQEKALTSGRSAALRAPKTGL